MRTSIDGLDSAVQEQAVKHWRRNVTQQQRGVEREIDHYVHNNGGQSGFAHIGDFRLKRHRVVDIGQALDVPVGRAC